MTITGDPIATAWTLVNAARSEGTETAVQAALDLTHYRWLQAERPTGWPAFARGLVSGETFWSSTGALDTEAGTRMPPPVRQKLIDVFKIIPDEHPQDEELRIFLHGVFEHLLTMREANIGRAGAGNSTNQLIAGLISDVVGTGARLLDPACGLGNTLLRSAKHPRRQVIGFEINKRISVTAEARFELAGIDARIYGQDWLVQEVDSGWDSICIEPPYSLQLTDQQKTSNPNFSTRGKSDMVWVHKAIEWLASDGIAVIMLPARTMWSEQEAQFRNELLHLGLIEAIVSLPGGAALGTGIETCLWVVRKTSAPHREDRVLLVNGAGSALDDSTGSQARDQIAADILRWRSGTSTEPTWRSGAVSVQELKSKRDVSPSAHLDPAPSVTEPRPSSPVRLLSNLRVEGFKAVDRPLSINLKPLTLIYGRNSAGKSSLIQSLLLMRQSLPSQRLATRGDGFDLGNFRGLVTKHEVERPVRVGVSFGLRQSADLIVGSASPSYLRALDMAFEQDLTGVARSSEVMISLGGEQFEFLRESKSDSLPFTITAPDMERLVSFVTSGEFAFPLQKGSSEMGARVRRGLKRLQLQRVDIQPQGSYPSAIADLDLDSRTSGVTRAGLANGGVRRGLKATAAVAKELEELFSRTVYLGPLREPPHRVNTRQDANRSGTDIPFYLLDNSSERELVSAWMHRIGIDYDLDVFSLANSQGAHVLGDIATVVLRNERKGVALSTADVGFGVSQVLPIMVELSARTESVILIEQPEIHLHPAMQSELADLLIESTDEAGRSNQVIAETHSEHIMLRVQRRVREKQLDPSQVAVIYVDQGSDGSAFAKELRLDQNGDFVDDWPNGFFSERFDEVFSGLL